MYVNATSENHLLSSITIAISLHLFNSTFIRICFFVCEIKIANIPQKNNMLKRMVNIKEAINFFRLT